jgi:hypothetical protein
MRLDGYACVTCVHMRACTNTYSHMPRIAMGLHPGLLHEPLLQGWACERMLLSDAFQGRLLMVLPSDPASHVKKVRGGALGWAAARVQPCLGTAGLPPPQTCIPKARARSLSSLPHLSHT